MSLTEAGRLVREALEATHDAPLEDAGQPAPPDIQETVFNALRGFVLSNVLDMVERIASTGSVESAVPTTSSASSVNRPSPSRERGTNEKRMEGVLAGLRAMLQESRDVDERMSHAREAVVSQRAELEALLLTIQQRPVNVPCDAALSNTQQAANEAADPEESQLRSQAQAADEASDKLKNEIAAMTDTVGRLQAAQLQEEKSMESDNGLQVDSNEQTPESIEADNVVLQERVEWMRALLETLEGLYGLHAEVITLPGAFTDTGCSDQAVKLVLTYPTQHCVELRLSHVKSKLRVAAATVRVPQSERRLRNSLPISLDDVVASAATMPPPEDVMFVVREAGLRVAWQDAAVKEVKQLMKTYITKLTDVNELATTLPEGVVASFRMLPGYPELPGTLRLTSLVGVGGWRDADLAAISNDLNRSTGRPSLLGMVDQLAQRIAQLDNQEG